MQSITKAVASTVAPVPSANSAARESLLDGGIGAGAARNDGSSETRQNGHAPSLARKWREPPGHGQRSAVLMTDSSPARRDSANGRALGAACARPPRRPRNPAIPRLPP